MLELDKTFKDTLDQFVKNYFSYDKLICTVDENNPRTKQKLLDRFKVLEEIMSGKKNFFEVIKFKYPENGIYGVGETVNKYKWWSLTYYIRYTLHFFYSYGNFSMKPIAARKQKHITRQKWQKLRG